MAGVSAGGARSLSPSSDRGDAGRVLHTLGASQDREWGLEAGGSLSRGELASPSRVSSANRHLCEGPARSGQGLAHPAGRIGMSPHIVNVATSGLDGDGSPFNGDQ